MRRLHVDIILRIALLLAVTLLLTISLHLTVNLILTLQSLITRPCVQSLFLIRLGQFQQSLRFVQLPLDCFSAHELHGVLLEKAY